MSQFLRIFLPTLGLANDRRTLIPWEVKDENECLTTDKDYVLSKWKSNYEKLFNDNLDNRNFENGHLNKVRECIQDPDNLLFQNSIVPH